MSVLIVLFMCIFYIHNPSIFPFNLHNSNFFTWKYHSELVNDAIFAFNRKCFYDYRWARKRKDMMARKQVGSHLVIRQWFDRNFLNYSYIDINHCQRRLNMSQLFFWTWILKKIQVSFIIYTFHVKIMHFRWIRWDHKCSMWNFNNRHNIFISYNIYIKTRDKSNKFVFSCIL